MADTTLPYPVNEEDLKYLKELVKVVDEADPVQYHNDYCLKRYLKAFKTIKAEFLAIFKTNRWRTEYGIKDFTSDHPDVKKHDEGNKAKVLKNRYLVGRPVVYIPAKNHNVNDRNVDE